MIGKTLGHYQITEKLGQGGMGVIYKARDTHLDRFVAIKTLPPERLADPERKRRFIQEAKAASALNHPSIITIHDIDQAEGIDFIAMEYVAGKTLDELIPRKGMRLSLALKYAVQIADALARAHGAEIIHRDLKPSNVMVDEHGLVKVLDFGLAKLTEAGPVGDDASTRTAQATTEKGTILGTVAYMSPEQAEGKLLDARSDIFSFGSVLYEMVTGRRAFQGDSKMSTLSAVLQKEPPPLTPDIPHDLAKLVTRCLRKDPDKRFHHMVDVRVALEELKEESDSGRLLSPSPAARSRWRSWHWLILAVAVLATAWGVWRLRPPGASQDAFREKPFTTDPGFEYYASFSPDGTTVAFTKSPDLESRKGTQPPAPSIQLKMIGADSTQLLKQGASGSVWSPDGKWIAYFSTSANGLRGPAGICVIPRIGGAERKIAEVRLNHYPDRTVAWTPDGKWLISTDQQDPKAPYHLALVLVETGEKMRLTTPPAGIYGDTGPALSPDGETLAFTRHSVWGRSDLYLLSLDASHRPRGEPWLLKTGVPNANCAVWTGDGREIVFCSRVWAYATLWRTRADGSSKAQPLPFGGFGAYFPDVARTGNRMVYTRHVWDNNIWRVELDAAGRAKRAPECFIQSSLGDFNASWSPDGNWIAFGSERSGRREIWLAEASGANPRQITNVDSTWGMTPHWSPDSRWIVFEADVEGNQDLYLVSAQGGKPRRLTPDPTNEYGPRWSQDGQWIYFRSDRGGQDRLWKVAPGGGDVVPAEGARPGKYDAAGANVFYAKSSGGGYALWKEPTAGGQAQKVVEGMANSSFALSSKGVYYTARNLEDPFVTMALMFHEFAMGKAVKLADIRLGTGSGIGHSVSSDGRFLVYTQTDRETDDLMLVENFR